MRPKGTGNGQTGKSLDQIESRRLKKGNNEGLYRVRYPRWGTP